MSPVPVDVLLDLMLRHDSDEAFTREALALALQQAGYPPDAVEVTAPDAVYILDTFGAGLPPAATERSPRREVDRPVVSIPQSRRPRERTADWAGESNRADA